MGVVKIGISLPRPLLERVDIIARRKGQSRSEFVRRSLERALVEEMSARVKEAEAEVPRAMAEAFRSGNLGIMDYYRMRNIQADTEMRTSISDTGRDETRRSDS